MRTISMKTLQDIKTEMANVEGLIEQLQALPKYAAGRKSDPEYKRIEAHIARLRSAQFALAWVLDEPGVVPRSEDVWAKETLKASQ